MHRMVAYERGTLTRRSLIAGLAAALATRVPGATAQAPPGQRGVELLRTWAAGRLPKASVPLDWVVYAPAQGAAFYHPAAWQVVAVTDPNLSDLADGNPFGSVVTAPDRSAAVLLLNMVANTPVAARDVAWTQLGQALQSASLRTLADDVLTTVAGVPAAFAAGQGTDTIAAVLVLTQPDTVLGGTYLYIQLVLAPADRFDAAAEAIFVPLLQNQVTDGGSACDPDPTDDPYTLDDCPSV